jgi:hypothetical protein
MREVIVNQRRWWAPTATLALFAAVVVQSAVSAQNPRLPAFRDVARSAGIDFVHINGASEHRFFPEIVGSGGLFFDFDNDGWLDVFLVDGGSLADTAVAGRARHRLYRKPPRNGTFEDVMARRASGIATMEWAPAPATTTTTV